MKQNADKQVTQKDGIERTVTADNSDWYRGTADAMYQNIDFLKRRHEPYVIISSGGMRHAAYLTAHVADAER